MIILMSAIVWIGFFPMMQFCFARHMFMHFYALLFSFSYFLSISSAMIFYFLFYFYFLFLFPSLVSDYGTQKVCPFLEPDHSSWFFISFFSTLFFICFIFFFWSRGIFCCHLGSVSTYAC